MSPQVADSRDRWALRRKVLYATLTFCAVIVVYLTIWGQDTALHRDIAYLCIVGAMGLVGWYVGMPVIDDWLQRRKGGPGHD